MSEPTFSVIVPAYNQARYLPACIESVLAQRDPDLELIVVDDASPDEGAAIAAGYDDPRIRLIRHEENRGLSGARNSGLRAARGRLIALLDADDRFLPDKLAAHRAHFAAHPQIGASYNGRLHIDPDGEPFNMWLPPTEVGLEEFLLGFPFAPSDMVVRREWVEKVGSFDESFVHYGEDRDYTCRLALAGCRFLGIDRLLNARRFYPDRRILEVEGRLDGALRGIEKALADPRCPAPIHSLAPRARALAHLSWAYPALLIERRELGRDWLEVALEGVPELRQDGFRGLEDFLVWQSLMDRGDYAAAIRTVLAQLPESLAPLARREQGLIGRAALLSAVRELTFEHHERAGRAVEQARAGGRHVDEALVRLLIDHLRLVEGQLGRAHADRLLERLDAALEPLATLKQRRALRAGLAINRAFDAYRARDYGRVPAAVGRALRHDAGYLANRGVLAILGRSLLARARGVTASESGGQR